MLEYVLNTSLRCGRTIAIIYSKDNVLTKRNIKVLEIKQDSIRAYCFLRGQVRIFKKSNILAADFLRAARGAS